MKGILSLFSMRGKRRKKLPDGADRPTVPVPEMPPDRQNGEDVPEKRNVSAGTVKPGGDPESGGAGVIRRITETIRSLTVRAEKAVREFAGTGSEEKTAGAGGYVRKTANLSSVPPERRGSSSVLRTGRTVAPDLSSVPDDPRGEAARSGPDELFSVPPFRAEMRAEDLPFRQGSFPGDTESGGEDPSRESYRLLLDRTEELKEILSRLNETADEIRKELTI